MKIESEFEQFVATLDNTLSHKHSGDYIEKNWIKLVNFSDRKKKGQIPTPLKIAQFMAMWAMHNNKFSSFSFDS